MDTIEFKQALWEELDSMRPRNRSNNKQIAIRCPFCGDSKKPTSTHFGVLIDTADEDSPVVFNCFLCNTHGIMTPSVLRTLEINDLTLNSGLIKLNRRAAKNMKKEMGITDNSFDFKAPLPDPEDEGNKAKKKYFEDRLNIKTTFEEMAGFKCIFKLGQFLRDNEIKTYTSTKDKAIHLHNNYLGFLTTRNEFINFRQVLESPYKRYEKYNVFKNLDNTRKFYTIPNQIDLLTDKTITINIAEGVFDIMGVYYHIFNKERENMIYVAVCGAGYVSVLKYFISMGVIGNVKINIFSDSDKSPSYYVPIEKELKPWVSEINLFYNEKKKDFGEPKHNIRILKKKIRK